MGGRLVRVGGVHGIRQSGTSEEQLTQDWSGALDRGLRAQGHPPLPHGTLKLPHWAWLLGRGREHLGPQDDPFDTDVPLSDEETGFVTAALGDVVRAQDLARVDQYGIETLGPPQAWPASLNRLVCAYDLRFPNGGGKLFVRLMREVRLYLCRPELAARVRTFVAEGFGAAGAGVVLGHSLGSVIAYDLLRRGEVNGVRTLVTCGSPLTVATVRRALGVADGERLVLPEEVRWVNAFDPGDFVTGGSGLGRVAMGVADAQVHNGRADPHSALRYLRAEPVVRAVAERHG